METIVFVGVFLWVPVFGFSVYLANEKGYHSACWMVLSFFFPLPTFMTLLGLPVRSWHDR